MSALLGEAIILGRAISGAVNITLQYRQANADMVMSTIDKYNIEEGKIDIDNDGNIKIHNLLNGDNRMLGDATEESERNNKMLLPDALALCTNIYRIADGKPNGYHTKSYDYNRKEGWIWLNDYIAHPDAYSYISKKMASFINNIKDIKYTDNKTILGNGLVSGVFFQYINDKSFRIAYVIKGTTYLKDWGANGKQGLNGNSALYENAFNIANTINCKLQDGMYLYIMGHSLGGGVANYIAMKLKKPAITFNAASVHPDTVMKNLENYQHLVKNNSMIGIYVKDEALSNPDLYFYGKKIELSNNVGLPKNGNRYSVASDKEYFKKGDIVDLHSLEPLCNQWGLTRMNWNKRGNNTI